MIDEAAFRQIEQTFNQEVELYGFKKTVGYILTEPWELESALPFTPSKNYQFGKRKTNKETCHFSSNGLFFIMTKKKYDCAPEMYALVRLGGRLAETLQASESDNMDQKHHRHPGILSRVATKIKGIFNGNTI
jgi:hypothetical protein